eukprot:TRINITY_DN1568_c0_g1_i1.p1 TRINITY_DN1568_c0_g1~~TRINITY_DN1568_c0_g1_i1.p1  ORF type:complete len:1371 (+),score=475.37 TRINITY_DN1568_c0_g1_i1:150-4262(+)
MSSAATIGSFRDAGGNDDHELQGLLPKRLRYMLSEESVPASADWRPSFPFEPTRHYLNHGAFGAPFKEISELADAIRSYQEKDPGLYFDRVCLPLVRRSYAKAREVFQSDCIALVPNCTMGMRGVMEALLERTKGSAAVAYLPPLYGASQKLVQWLGEQRRLSAASEVPLNEALFEEDGEAVAAALSRHHAASPFSVLIADHVASQSGRILPLPAVTAWCKRNGVTLVVDGTQSFDLSLGDGCWPDYYVMSTHKWLGNIKTCGIVRYHHGVPPPTAAAISFGHGRSDEDAHLWVGMMDYTPQITLAKVLSIHQRHGKRIAQEASAMLRANLPVVGRAMLPPRVRLMDLVSINRHEEDLQNRLEDAGISVSVKTLGGQRYVRVSCFSHNTPADFQALARFLNYTVMLNQVTPPTLAQQDPGKAAMQKRIEIRNDFTSTFDLYTRLFSEHMTPGAFFVKAEPLRHPLIFYYGHTAVFFMNKMVLGGWRTTTQRINPELESHCAVGVDEMSWDDCDPGNYPWGHLQTESEKAAYVEMVTEYRRKMRKLMVDMIMDPKHELTLPIDPHSSFFWIVMMGIEHERIHVETSSVIMARIPVHMLRKSPKFPPCPFYRADRSAVPQNRLVPVPGGTVEMGRPWEGTPYYGWDNEFGHEKRVLRPFQASTHLVSNAEYMEFVEAGGYKTREFWSEDGWKWAQWNPKGLPLFWMGKDKFRALAQELPMPWDWPVDVNNHEASAFCEWKSKQLGRTVRLISHEEWLLMRSKVTGSDHNINLREFSSACPVDCHGSSRVAADGSNIYDVTGNLWQHSRSVLTLMPQFKPHRVYDDFTTPTIDGRHSFILGGSWTSIGNCARPEARYGFRRHFHQFAGIRYVVSDNDFHATVPIVFEKEIGPVVSEHFAPSPPKVAAAPSPVPNWPAWFGEYAAEQINALSADAKRVLVVNGGAGRISLEILKRCPGIRMHHSDPTAALVRVLENLAESGRIQWQHQAEGEIEELNEFIDAEGSAKSVADRVEYSQILINNISGATKHHKQYDVVVAEMSQLARLESQLPRGQIPGDLALLLRPGGALVVAAPAPQTSEGAAFDAAALGPFEALGGKHRVPHVARQAGRQLRYAVSEASTWQLHGDAVPSAPAAPAKAEPPAVAGPEHYSQPHIVEQCERMHWGTSPIGVPNFPKTVADLCVRLCQERGLQLGRALDAGCGPGRTAAELAAHFRETVAFDRAAPLIETAKRRAPQGGVKFMVGDAHHVDELVQGKFDLVLAANLIERMERPAEFLRRCKGLLSDRGLLVVLSPCTWQERWTPREHWLGGFRKDAEVYPTWQGLSDTVKPELEMIGEPRDVPYAMDDIDGTYEYVVSQCTVFGAPESAAAGAKL